MILIVLKNKINNKNFEKHFDSPFLARQFLQKCYHSKKVSVIDVFADTIEEYDAVK